MYIQIRAPTTKHRHVVLPLLETHVPQVYADAVRQHV